MSMTSQRSRKEGRPTLLGGAVVLAVVAVMLAIAGVATKASDLYVWAAICAVVAVLLWALSRRPHEAKKDPEHP
jgi:peptidoglycan/LPS O-acetylase OafA/YrhL